MRATSWMAMGVIGAASALANAGVAEVVAMFDLHDHPDGSAAQPYYGLRLDNIGAPGTMTLSMAMHSNTTLSVIEEDGQFSIRIQGTLHGGQVSSNEYVSSNDYSIDFTYGANVIQTANGYRVDGFTTLNSGTLTNLDTEQEIELFGKPNMQGLAFTFQADGHRMSGDSTTWVGRGWLTDESDGSAPGAGSQDWLFYATEVPTPGGSLLLACSGLVIARRRR